MSWFNKKSTVEEYEEEFKANKLKQKHIFYDLYLTTGDPEEMRAFASELMDDADYNININKLTNFDDMEVEGIFKGGKLKPLRGVIKGTKSYEKGVKHPLLWKVLVALGVLSFLLVLIFKTQIPLPGGFSFDPQMFYLTGGIFLILGFIIYMLKEKIDLMIWLKVAGVYNIDEAKADVRIVLAGESEKKDKGAINALDDDLNEIYQVIAKKYIKKGQASEKITIVKQDTAETKIFEKLREVSSELDKFTKRLADQKISEKTYTDIKEQLEKKKKNLETMLDLLGTVQ